MWNICFRLYQCCPRKIPKHLSRQDGRVVSLSSTALQLHSLTTSQVMACDSSASLPQQRLHSHGLCPRGFESPSCQISFCCQNLFVGLTAVAINLLVALFLALTLRFMDGFSSVRYAEKPSRYLLHAQTFPKLPRSRPGATLHSNADPARSALYVSTTMTSCDLTNLI
jgi:hypothetical protein